MHPPDYFEGIRRSASARWVQLEQDPELAAPWHQLFKQVQSPRHVLSELLQNADDAGATEAVVSIKDGTFRFGHNGADFSAEHFQSLCRFGYSNKRSLHTIGFRGIGFKSTFSIGDEVRLYTPTLSIAYRRERFTEPIWTGQVNHSSGWTEIHVTIKDEYRQRELQKNLQEWAASPVSLLFFQSIRRLLIEEKEIHWEAEGQGPVTESEWMKLSTDPERRYLLVRSPEEEFPQAALEEIRQERMTTDDGLSFPPCRVEIVLGMEGRLFVVLPTGVKTDLPFASSAPFVQDPARVKIKDPDISPTNRWLLKRIGDLAARALLGWVGNAALPEEERAKAYALWMTSDHGDGSLEAGCAAIVSDAFGSIVKTERCLLADSGSRLPWQGGIGVPGSLLEVWTRDQVSDLFDQKKRPVLSRYIAVIDRIRIAKWGAFDELSLGHVVTILKSTSPPRPTTWRKLLLLWACLSSELLHPWRRQTGVRLFPVQGADVLYAANEIARLGERQLLQSQDDWSFLADYLRVLNQNWTRYLADQRRDAEEQKDSALGEQVEAAYKVLREFGMDDTSDIGQVMAMVSERFFSQPSCDRADCVRLAHIAAKLGAPIPATFQFVTRDGYRRPLTSRLVVDSEGDLDLFVTPAWYEQHVLHEDYVWDFQSCTESEWRQWSTAPRTGLLTFVPLSNMRRTVRGVQAICRELFQRGLEAEVSLPYQSADFMMDDWDFESATWDHWQQIAKEDEHFWVRLMTRILRQAPGYWSKATLARASQVARTGSSRAITTEPLLPGWIVKLRGLPCLQDTWGRWRHPAQLLRRTPVTEPLLDTEPFVRAEFDTEALRPLLVLLGVRDTPTGPDPLVERLQALAGLPNPPLHEVQKWYHRLDQIAENFTTEDLQDLRSTFQVKSLILTEDNEWVRSAEVFLRADEEDAPGAAIVHSAVRHLSLWRKLEVSERPTAELALAWLKSLPSGHALSPDELRRVRALLPRYPDRIWTECGHWLNLDGGWAPVEGLTYAITMQSLVPWKHLFQSVKERTADLQKLPADVCERSPFARLALLGSCIEEQFADNPGGLLPPQAKPWLAALGGGLSRLILEEPEQQERLRQLGRRLAATRWQSVKGLEIVPYLNGTPAGTPRRSVALWREDLLYVQEGSAARVAAAVSQELGRAFGRSDIGDAIKLCYERSLEFVLEYIETTFRLEPPEQMIKAWPPVVEGEYQADTALQETAATVEHSQEQPLDFAAEPPGEPSAQVGSETSQPSARPPRQPKHSEPPQPPKPSLFERYALANGFGKIGGDRFARADGSILIKASESLFHWELWSAARELLQSYWVKEHCMEFEPLEIDSPIWQLCEQHPRRYTLVLTNPQGDPVAIQGQQLMELRDRGELSLHPSTYRLVYRS